MELDPAHHTQRIYGLYEREITQTVRQYALEANTIVDVGAHDGYYTVTLAVINPRAKIFACEPEPELKHECLKSQYNRGCRRSRWLLYCYPSCNKS